MTQALDHEYARVEMTDAQTMKKRAEAQVERRRISPSGSRTQSAGRSWSPLVYPLLAALALVVIAPHWLDVDLDEGTVGSSARMNEADRSPDLSLDLPLALTFEAEDSTDFLYYEDDYAIALSTENSVGLSQEGDGVADDYKTFGALDALLLDEEWGPAPL